MNEQTVMWIFGGAGAVAVSLLGLIWSELRGMRHDLSLLDKSHSTTIARLDNVEEVLSKLPCYREFNCPKN